MKTNKNIWLVTSLMVVLLVFVAVQKAECECRLWSFIANQGYTINDNQTEADIQLDAFYIQSIGQDDGWTLLCYDDNCYVDSVERSNVPADETLSQWSNMVRLHS